GISRGIEYACHSGAALQLSGILGRGGLEFLHGSPAKARGPSEIGHSLTERPRKAHPDRAFRLCRSRTSVCRRLFVRTLENEKLVVQLQMPTLVGRVSQPLHLPQGMGPDGMQLARQGRMVEHQLAGLPPGQVAVAA